MILKSDGRLVLPYDPQPRPVRTMDEILAEQAGSEKLPSWDEFKHEHGIE